MQKTVIFTAGLLVGILIPSIFLNSNISELNRELLSLKMVIVTQNKTIDSLRENVARLENKTSIEEQRWLFYGDITPEQAQRLLESQNPPILVDVRSESEFNESRISKAVNIPINELSGRLEELNEDSEYIVYCKSGSRSRQAFLILKTKGFSKLYNIIGGVDNWSRFNLPLNKKCPCGEE